jgi:hypothetical protein
MVGSRAVKARPLACFQWCLLMGRSQPSVGITVARACEVLAGDFFVTVTARFRRV